MNGGVMDWDIEWLVDRLKETPEVKAGVLHHLRVDGVLIRRDDHDGISEPNREVSALHTQTKWPEQVPAS
jgi:hypothetical protein